VLSKTQLVSHAGTNRSFVLAQTWGDTGSANGKLQSQTYPSLAKCCTDVAMLNAESVSAS